MCCLWFKEELPSSITDSAGPGSHECALAEIGRIMSLSPQPTGCGREAGGLGRSNTGLTSRLLCVSDEAMEAVQGVCFFSQ